MENNHEEVAVSGDGEKPEEASTELAVVENPEKSPEEPQQTEEEEHEEERKDKPKAKRRQRDKVPERNATLVSEAAILGKLDFIYPPTPRLIRLYIHSTGEDTAMERAHLKEHSYPKLRRYCRERGLDFQMIDLHTCDLDEHPDDHVTKEFCLREIDKCMDLSVGPNFVTFQAQKYGKPVLPRQIDVTTMKRIVKALQDNEEEKELLLNWYSVDENMYPSTYVLSPISTTVPYYSEGMDTDALTKWLEIQDRLLDILYRASADVLSEDDRNVYNTSESEQEYQWSLLTDDEEQETPRRYWFRRDITDLLENINDAKACDYIDMVDGHVSEEARAKLTSLRETTMCESINMDSIHAFDITWSTLADEEERTKYLTNVREMFEETITSHVDIAIKRLQNLGIDDTLRLYIQNIVTAQQHMKYFLGRDSFFEQMEEKLKKKKSPPSLVLHGKTGSGKTALICKLAGVVHNWFRNPAVILRTHGIGTKWTTRKLLTSLCTQIHDINGNHNLVDDIPVDENDIKDYFKQLLSHQEEQTKHICILLDVLDELGNEELAELSKWLPTTAPTNISLIVAVTDTVKTWKSIKKHYSKSLLAIPTLDAEEMTQIMQIAMKNHGRSLQLDQWAVMELFCPDNPTPFQLNLAANTARHWQSSDHISDCELPDDMEEIITQMFERLEKKHGMEFVNRVFGFLSASSTGLTLGEIEDLVATGTVVPDTHKAPLFPGIRTLPLLCLIHDAGFYLQEREIFGTLLYQWRNEIVTEMARTRYLPEDSKATFHNDIIKYLTEPVCSGDDINGNPSVRHLYIFNSSDSLSRCLNTRALMELPYQLREVKRYDDLMNCCLLNVEYLEAKITITCIERRVEMNKDLKRYHDDGIDYTTACRYLVSASAKPSVLAEYDMIDTEELDNDDVKAVHACLNNNKTQLAEHSSHLALCLLQELTKSPDDLSDAMEQFLDQARSPAFNCLLSSKVRVELDKDYPKLGKFTGATDAINSIDIGNDGTQCLAVGQDKCLRVWDTIELEELFKLDLSTYEPYLSTEFLPLARFCNYDQWAVLASTTILNFVELTGGALMNRIELDEDATLHVDFIANLNLILVVGEFEIEAWNIVTGEEAESIDVPEPIKIEDEVHAGRLEDFIATDGTDIIFYRAGGTTVKIFHYQSNDKPDTYALYGKKQARKRVVRFAVTPSKNLVCYHFVPPVPTTENPAPSLDVTIDIVDIQTTSKIHSFKKQDCGAFLGLERVFPVGSQSFAIVCHPLGSTVVRVYDIASRSIMDAYILPGDFISAMASTCEGEIAFTTRKNQADIEFVDLYKALDLKRQEMYTGDKDPEAEEIICELPGTRRYVLFMTKDIAIGVWDLAHRICVRVLDIAFPGTYATCVTSTSVAGVDPISEMLVSVDMCKGEITARIKKGPYQIRDGHCRVGKAADGSIAVVGPKPNKLSGVELDTGKIKWSCAVGASTHIGGVIVSSDGRFAVCEVPADPEKNGQPSTKEATESKLYAFNLKKAERLPDLKLKTTKPLSTKLVLEEKAFLTPGGIYYVTFASTTDGDVIAVFNTKKGTVRIIPNVDGAQSISLGHSKSLRATVVGCSDGKLRLWRFKGLKMDTFDTGRFRPVTRLFVSKDGVFVGCIFNGKKGTLYLYNLMSRTLHSVYASKEDIIHCFFTSQNEFLLLSRENVRGLMQLCIHTAAPAMITVGEGQEAKANGPESSQSKGQTSNTLSVNASPARPTTGRRTARPLTGRRSAIARRRRDSNRSILSVLSARDADVDHKRLFVEDAYLDNMMQMEDLYGEPMQYECFD